jgi:hypothetical protein
LDTVTSLDKFRVPVGNQEVELQQFIFEAGGMPLGQGALRLGRNAAGWCRR